MSTIRHTTEFAAAPPLVWSYLEDPERLKLWMVGVTDIRPVSEGPVGVGATFEMDIKEGGRITTYQETITTWEPPKKMGVRLVGGCGKTPMTMHADYELVPLDGGARTQLHYLCRAEMPKGFLFKLFGPLVKLMGKFMIKKFMRNLRRLVEAPDAAATAG